MARTRRMKLSGSDHTCSRGFWDSPLTSHANVASSATRPPFSRTSTDDSDERSRRDASSSAASSTVRIHEDLKLKASNTNQRLLHVPRRGNVLERDLESATFGRS